MIDLTRYGIVAGEFTWPAGEIANSQASKTRFLNAREEQIDHGMDPSKIRW